MGLAEGLLGCGQVADAQADLADLIERLRQRAQVEALQLVAGQRASSSAFVPGAAETHNLCPMHAAEARETR